MSLSTHIKKVVEASGKKSLLSLIFSFEGLKCFADGNIGYMKLVKGPAMGTLVGTDSFGNRYYENDSMPYARKRWVVYKDTFDYSPSSVPAEWHGWLEGISDFTPANYQFPKPIYAIDHYQTRTGTAQCYQPKGAWANSHHKMNWKKAEVWQPPKV